MDPPIPAAPEQGACINCGFLCRRDIVNTHLGLFRELTDEDWRVGRFFTLFGYPLVPWCFRQVPIHQEIAEGAGSPVETSPLTANGADLVDKQNAAAAAVTRKDRRCLLWMLYQPCLGPEAHLSGQAMRDMELRQAQRAEHLEADRRKLSSSSISGGARQRSATSARSGESRSSASSWPPCKWRRPRKTPSSFAASRPRGTSSRLDWGDRGRPRPPPRGPSRTDVQDGRAAEGLITGKGNKDRVVFFDESSLEAIRIYLEARCDSQLPLHVRHDDGRGRPGPRGERWRLSPQSVGRGKKYGALAGVKVTTHHLRHLKARTLLNQGAQLAEVQDILGHASPETTKKIYAHYTTQRLREAFDRYSLTPEEVARRARRPSRVSPGRSNLETAAGEEGFEPPTT